MQNDLRLYIEHVVQFVNNNFYVDATKLKENKKQVIQPLDREVRHKYYSRKC